jgi:predicted nucleic acid-binding Zn ribbon protein
MSRYDGPKSLGDSLRDLVSRYRKVDLAVMDEIRRRWPELLDAKVAARCEPQVVREGVLYVQVPTGAYAEAIRRSESSILERLADLGERAPVAVRAVVGDAPRTPR